MLQETIKVLKVITVIADENLMRALCESKDTQLLIEGSISSSCSLTYMLADFFLPDLPEPNILVEASCDED